MDAELQAELNSLIRRLLGMQEVTKRERDNILSKAAAPLRSAIAGKAPKGVEQHLRYSTPKISGKLRAPKGSGQVVATYKPGNLKKSISTLRFRRSKAVFIGPKVDRNFQGKMPDGYYAHMVNDGTTTQSAQRFVQSGVSAAGSTALNLAVSLMKQKIESYAAQNNLK